MKTYLFCAVAAVAVVWTISVIISRRRWRRNERKPQKPKHDIEKLQKEREHIERLFADRINFYLVFAAGILIFVFDRPHEPELLKDALFVVVIVSLSMFVALLRTFFLVKDVLHDIERYSEEPYTTYSKRLWMLPNANDLLLFLPIAITAFFIYAFIKVWQDFPALPNS
jgi:hypothetical protein